MLTLRFSASDPKRTSRLGTKGLYIEPDSPWENGYCASFNGKLRDACLNGEIFYSLKEAQTVIESWRTHYNTRRPHSALGYRPPAPLTILPQLDEPLAMNCLSHRLVQKIGQAKGGDPGWRFKIPKPPVSALARFGKAAYASAAET